MPPSLSFGGYPDTDANSAVEVSTLGLVPCETGVFFDATFFTSSRTASSFVFLRASNHF